MKLTILLFLILATSATLADETTNLSTEIRYDSRNRPVIATYVNEEGPYFMVVDTGAESSLMMPALAERLKLESFDTGLTINGATGTIAAQAFPVDKFSSELFEVSYVGLLSLPHTGSTEAAGIIGMDLFAANALVFDFSEGKMRVVPSGAVKGNYITVPAIADDALLLRVNVNINGVDMPALIDTGAAATIGNLAALKALGWKATDPHLVDDGAILGATSDISQIKKATVNTIAIDGIVMREVPVRFTINADSRPPSLILGSDILNSLVGFAIDFPKREFMIQLPPSNSEADRQAEPR